MSWESQEQKRIGLLVEAIDWLLNYATVRNINYQLLALSPTTSSVALPKQQLIIINVNWHKPFELPFIIGHEISHVIFRHQFSNAENEQAADYGALCLLIIYTQTLSGSTDVFEICVFPERISKLAADIRTDLGSHDFFDTSDFCNLS